MEELKYKAVWSYHSLERASEERIRFDQLVSAWDRSTVHHLNEKHKAYKFKKYGMASLDDRYYYDSKLQLLFTVHLEKNQRPIVITVTKGLGNLTSDREF